MGSNSDIVLTAIKSMLQQVVPKGTTVLLFGSQARGDAHEGSDWDLLILLNKPRVDLNDYDEVAFPLCQLGWDLGVVINPILYSLGDWEKQSVTPFYKKVTQDSVELWN